MIEKRRQQTNMHESHNKMQRAPARWSRGAVVRTSVFGRRTFRVLRLIYGWHVTTLWVKCPHSAMCLPTRPSQPSIPLGSANE